MAWKALVELWFVTLVTSDLLVIQCWWHTAHSTHEPPMWDKSSPLCLLLACISDFPSTSKILLTRCKLSEYHGFYKMSHPLPRNQSLKIIPSFLFLECGYSLEHEKCVTFIPPCSVPGLNLESCLDALVTKLFFVGFHSSQRSRATQGNREGAIFNYFLYFATQ